MDENQVGGAILVEKPPWLRPSASLACALTPR